MLIRNYYKRHIKICRAIAVCVSLFILISCGIPTNIYLNNAETDEDVSYYYFSNEIVEDDSITTKLKFNLVDSSYDVEDSPSICYFYSIFPNEANKISQSNYVSYIENEFNSTYSTLPGRRLDTSETDPYVLSVIKDESPIKLYTFKYNNLKQSAPTYLATIENVIYNNEYSLNLEISKSTVSGLQYLTFTEDSTNVLTSLNSSNNLIDTNNLLLSRFDGSSFINTDIDINSDYDYMYLTQDEIDSNDTYKVIIFAALSIEGDFSNIFWSELHEVGSFDI